MKQLQEALTIFDKLKYIPVILLFLSSIAEAAPITKVITVNQNLNFDIDYPRVSTDASGNAVITWTSGIDDLSVPGSELLTQDGSYSGVYARKLSLNGEYLSDEFQVNQTTDLFQGGSSVAIEDDGEFIISWASLFDSQPYLRKFDLASSAITDEILAASNNENISFTDISAYGSGTYVLTWLSDEDVNNNPSYHNVYGRIFDTSGSPISNKFMVNNTVKWPNVSNKVDTNVHGEFVVAWESQTTDPHITPGLPQNSPDGSGYAIFVRKFDSSGTPTTPDILVNTTTEGSQRDPDVAINNDGEFVVVWHDLSNAEVKQQRFNDIGVKVASEESISLPDAGTNTPMNPSMDMNDTGSYVVSWTTISPPSDNNIVVKQFDKNGTAVSEQVSVGGSGYRPDIAVNSDGSFVVTWYNSSQSVAARFFDSEIIVPFSDKEENVVVTSGENGGGSLSWYVLTIITLIRLTRSIKST